MRFLLGAQAGVAVAAVLVTAVLFSAATATARGEPCHLQESTYAQQQMQWHASNHNLIGTTIMGSPLSVIMQGSLTLAQCYPPATNLATAQ